MHPDDALLTLAGPLAHGVPDAVVEPPGQVLPDGLHPDGVAIWSGVPIEAVLASLRVLDSRPVEDAPGTRGDRSRVRKVSRPEKGGGVEVPRETNTLEGFEVWDRTVQAPEHQEVKVAFVSVRVGGNIGMNRAAYEMWGAP